MVILVKILSFEAAIMRVGESQIYFHDSEDNKAQDHNLLPEEDLLPR